MSTENVPARPIAAYEEEGGHDENRIVAMIGGGVLLLLVFLAFLCVAFFVGSSLIAGHPITDFMMTPTAP
ncbi:MAG TPA: hypothetical protein VM536_01585 [Chloroflexia bacterium]|nr:hypothetical protein [Chloroflexia bacterium]